jgi:hypothetical protein
VSIITCKWCGVRINMRQCTSNTCQCGRPPDHDPKTYDEVGTISEQLRAETFLGTWFEKPHYLSGRGHTLFDAQTKEPTLFRGRTLHCDTSGKLYQY